jgi:hypothetical protein
MDDVEYLLTCTKTVTYMNVHIRAKYNSYLPFTENYSIHYEIEVTRKDKQFWR